MPLRRYTHSANVDEPLQLETFTAAGSFEAAYTYHADHLGSIRYLTDTSGAIVNAYDYDSYGRPLFGMTSFDQPFAYTGREWDAATGLYHYRARQYDAETGRFLQEDPIGFAAGDLNIYRYVGSNPLSYADPSGLSAIEKGGLSKQALQNSTGLGSVAARAGCIFGNLGGVLSAVSAASTGNLGIAAIEVSGVTSCGGARVGITFSNKAKNLTENVLNSPAVRNFFVRTNGDILSSAAKNSTLKRIINSSFTKSSKIGNGSTSDAAKFTALTGQLVGGSTHVQKIGELRGSLSKLIHSGDLDPADLAIARVLLEDIQKTMKLIK